MPLILERKAGESFVIDPGKPSSITVTVVRVRTGLAKLEIVWPGRLKRYPVLIDHETPAVLDGIGEIQLSCTRGRNAKLCLIMDLPVMRSELVDRGVKSPWSRSPPTAETASPPCRGK